MISGLAFAVYAIWSCIPLAVGLGYLAGRCLPLPARAAPLLLNAVAVYGCCKIGYEPILPYEIGLFTYAVAVVCGLGKRGALTEKAFRQLSHYDWIGFLALLVTPHWLFYGIRMAIV